MSSHSSFWRAEYRRVLSCSTDRRELCLGRRGLMLTETSRGPRGTVQQENCGGGSADFLSQAMRMQGRDTCSFVGAQSGKKEVWTMSTLSTSDCLVHPADWPGFRMFSRLASNSKAWKPVRVPPRARHTPSCEGVFALTCVHSGWSGPSDAGRGVCLAWRVACSSVGERVQGRGWRTLRLRRTGLWIPFLVRPVGRGWPTPLHG